MIRKLTIAFVALAVLTALIALGSFLAPLHVESGNAGLTFAYSFYLSRGDVGLEISWPPKNPNWGLWKTHFRLAGLDYAGGNETYRVRLGLGRPFLVFTTVPVCRFVLLPIRRSRRRRQHQCVVCSYNLAGNLSGICPECGTSRRILVTTPRLRLAAGFVCALIAAMVLEFLNRQFAWEHRIGVLFARLFRNEAGVWLLPSAARSLTYAGVFAIVYIYLANSDDQGSLHGTK